MVKKVGEHVTLDIIGTKKEYEPSFFENLSTYPLLILKNFSLSSD